MRLLLLVVTAALAIAAGPAPKTARRQLKAGEVRLFTVEVETAAAFRRMMGASQELDKLVFDVSGTLELAVARVDGDSAVARVRLVEVGLRGKSRGQLITPEQFSATKKTLMHGVLVRLDTDGRHPFVDLTGAEDPQGTEMLRFLVAALQTTMPGDDSATWVAEERDPTGTYDASYRVTSRGSGGFKFEKTKTGYRDSMPTSGRSRFMTFAAKSEGLFVGGVGADGWLSELSGQELAQAFVGDETPISAVTTKIKVTGRGTRIFTPDEVKSLARAPMPDENSGTPKRRFDPERLRANAEATLGNMTVADVVKRGKELEATKKDGGGDGELEIFEKIRAFAIVHAERMGEIEAAIGVETQDSVFYRGAMLALGQLGTPAAQAVVRREIEAKLKKGDWESNVFLLPLLAEPEVPEEANDELLRSLRGDRAPPEVRTSAHLSLGRMADQLRTVAPLRAARIVDEYAGELITANTREGRSLMLDTLANSASPRLPQILKSELDSKDPDRQAGAVYALRLVRTKESLERSAQALESKDEDVRKAAAESLVHHFGLLSPYFDKILPKLKTETSSEIKHLLLRSLSDDVRRFPAVKAAVEAAATDDKDANVRSFAASILKTSGKVMLLP